MSSIERSFLVVTRIKNQNHSFSTVLKNLQFLKTSERFYQYVEKGNFSVVSQTRSRNQSLIYLIFYRFMRPSPLKRCRHVTLLRLKMHLYWRRTLARLHPRVVGEYYIFQASFHRFYAIAEHYTCGMARLNPFEGYVKPTKSRFSRSQKTVEKTVKPLETGGNVQTSVKDNEHGVTATAAS